MQNKLHDYFDSGVRLVWYVYPKSREVHVYGSPDEFNAYRQEGLEIGFLEIVAGPLVRSSYRAERVLQKNNVGIAI